jgi:hypothetical protein
MSDQPYDSRPDTLAHIARVQELIAQSCANLQHRAEVHDQSKLEESEKSAFDRCTVKLKTIPYGSEEYKTALAELKPALDHHYAANGHHPEHWPVVMTERVARLRNAAGELRRFLQDMGANDPHLELAIETLIKTADEESAQINGMSVYDLTEMLDDWKAATERMKDGGDIRRSLEINTDRFKISPQLRNILANTIEEMGW